MQNFTGRKEANIHCQKIGKLQRNERSEERE